MTLLAAEAAPVQPRSRRGDDCDEDGHSCSEDEDDGGGGVSQSLGSSLQLSQVDGDPPSVQRLAAWVVQVRRSINILFCSAKPICNTVFR